MGELGESQPLPEKPGFIRVYTGTTRKNFRQCAITEGEEVFYDKSKDFKQDDQTYYGFDLRTAIGFACARASELRDEPLIMSGLLDDSYRKQIKLYPGELLPVDTIWMARESWRILWGQETDPKNPEKGLLRLNPRKFLSEARLP